MIWTKRIGIAAMTGLLGTAFLASVATPRALAITLAFGRDGSTMSTDSVRSAETDSGDLIADSVRAALNADIGMAPAAAFKVSATAPKPANGDQAAGLVAKGSDTLSLLNLRGDQIMSALERSVSFEPQMSLGFLQVSGIKFSYDAKKEGGKRISSVTVNGQPLDASKRYKIATTKPLADGGQGYFQIWDKADIANSSTTTLESAIKDYVKSKGGSVSPTMEGRITPVEK